MAKLAIAGFFVLVVTCGVGFGVATADSTDKLARAGAFGFDAATHNATRALTVADVFDQDESFAYDSQVLTQTSHREIDAGLALIGEREAAERARIEADNKAVIKRVENMKAKQGVVSDWPADVAPAPDAIEYDLPAVDWSCGHDAFIQEWTARIDAYLAGSQLAGYGKVFAEAAWDNGIDPRWSPAISNTESGKGKVCFRSHNAWGWGNDDWPDWETAIRQHISGLARVYGYSITPEASVVYCPPNHGYWYANTISQMAAI